MSTIPTPHILTRGQRAVVLWAYNRRQQPFTLAEAIEGLEYGPKHQTHAETCVNWCVKQSMLSPRGEGKYVLTELARFLAGNINAALSDERSPEKTSKQKK